MFWRDYENLGIGYIGSHQPLGDFGELKFLLLLSQAPVYHCLPKVEFLIVVKCSWKSFEKNTKLLLLKNKKR